MNFGKVEDISGIDFSLPPIDKESLAILKQNNTKDFNVYVGLSKWRKSDLKGFYPRGTKDELTYYPTQFNAIEFNGTFYRMPTKEQIINWKERSLDSLIFCPKFTNSISHYSRLNNTEDKVASFIDSTIFFEDQLGMAFLQMPENFSTKAIDRLFTFLEKFPKGYPLALELRHQDWYSNPDISTKVHNLLKETNTTAILVDTPGRREMLNIPLSTKTAFIRFVATYNDIDKERLASWVLRIKEWKKAGIEKVYFFIHQKIDYGSFLLSHDFVNSLNKELKTNIPVARYEI